MTNKVFTPKLIHSLLFEMDAAGIISFLNSLLPATRNGVFASIEWSLRINLETEQATALSQAADKVQFIASAHTDSFTHFLFELCAKHIQEDEDDDESRRLQALDVLDFTDRSTRADDWQRLQANRRPHGPKKEENPSRRKQRHLSRKSKGASRDLILV